MSTSPIPPSNTMPLDFAAVMARHKDLKPAPYAPLTLITPQEKKTKVTVAKDRSGSSDNVMNGGVNGSGGTISMNNTNNNLLKTGKKSSNGNGVEEKKKKTTAIIPTTTPDLIYSEFATMEARRATELAYRLSLRTPIARANANREISENEFDIDGSDLNIIDDSDNKAQLSNLVDTMSMEERMRLEWKRKKDELSLPSTLHQVYLSDWERKINWKGVGGYDDITSAGADTGDDSAGAGMEPMDIDPISKSGKSTPNNSSTQGSGSGSKGKDEPSASGIGSGGKPHQSSSSTSPTTTATTNTASAAKDNNMSIVSSPVSSLPDPEEILLELYNPALEAIDLDNLISWDGADAPPGFNERLAEKMGILILQDGIAGTSVAAQSGAIIQTNPLPMVQSDVYRRRMELKHNVKSGNGSIPGTLRKDKAAIEREIKKRQLKRAQMAIDKTNRVKGALGKLDLGGGTGRAITSSLMGPGGTERTGRPARQNISSLAHDAEYVEQLDLVNNHTLVPADWNSTQLRHYHKPMLPRRIFKSTNIMPWQLQVRVVPSLAASLAKRRGGRGNMMMGMGMGMRSGAADPSASMMNATGALSQTKIRSGADLSPTEGSLIMFEFCEEDPPLQLTKGMASKIVNYYRGSKEKCPISAGGGDRPVRKKKHGNQEGGESAGTTTASNGSTGKVEKPPRLKGPSSSGDDVQVMDLIGKIPNKKNSDDFHGGSKGESKVTVLPEGKTELLHSKDHGPFIGAIKDGVIQSGLITNLFAAPIFKHEPRSTDFLMILGKLPNKHQSGAMMKLPVTIRSMPINVYCVGQTEPKQKVYAIGSSGEKNFYTPFSVYQIAKALQMKQKKENNGLKFEEISNGLFPYTDTVGTNPLRMKLKKVAIYDKNTQIWALKDIGFEDFQGVEMLGRDFSPEGVCCYVSSRIAKQRMEDLGIFELAVMANSVTNVDAAMRYLKGALSAARSRLRMLSKLVKNPPKGLNKQYVVKAEKKLDAMYKVLKRKEEVAKFIFEELQLAPWQLTADFIDVHKKGQGSGMMKLTGLGDPSGLGAGFNFIRENDGKANKASPNGDGALNARVKKITGTDKDLRKLNMKQMASILRSYGMVQKDIDKLKRWDRVHCIRDLSTKAASDNLGDGLERFARGEKIKLSEQRKTYRERIQEIWERQRITLTEDPGDARLGEEGLENEAGNAVDAQAPKEIDDSDEDEEEDDDDFLNEFEENWENTEKTNELVTNQLRGDTGGEGDAFRSAATLKKNANSEELSKDAMEYAALQRQREEERANKLDMATVTGKKARYAGKLSVDKDHKVIRRKVTKTQPDGTQQVTFKFFVLPSDVKRVLAEKNAEDDRNLTPKGRKQRKKAKPIIIPRDPSKPLVGHSLFEDEDDGGRLHVQVKRRARGGRRKADDDYTPSQRSRKTSKGGRKSTEKKTKRKRSEEDLDLYVTSARRKGTSNRKDRGAARDRMPHVIFADRLEQIRQGCEKRPASGPFHRPVDKIYNVYHERIKNPIDLQTIRDKIQKYEYRTVESFLADFELMKKNAVDFNGVGTPLGNEGTAIYEFIKATVYENKADFDAMEAAVEDQMNAGRRGSRSSTPKLPSQGGKAGKTANITIDGITTEVALGDLQGPFGDGNFDL